MASSAGEGGGRRVFLPIGLAAFITSLDTTVVNVAAPSIRRDLGLSLSGIEWVATSYVLAFASLLMVGGRLTDLIGRRRVLQLGMWLFALASVLVALADGGEIMLLGRVLQGAAAALVLPSALAILTADVDGKDRQIGAAVFTVAIAGSLALGPFVGGAISQYWHWSLIFWLNVPVVVITSAAVRWGVPNAALHGSVRVSDRSEFIARIDPAGLIFVTLALSSATFALVEGQKWGIGSPWIMAAVALCLAGTVATVLVERRARFPMIDLALVRHPVVAGGTLVQILWGLGINGVFFFTSLFLQDVLDLAPSVAGLAFLPLAGATIVVVPLGNKLADRWGPHRTIALGMMILAVGLAVVTLVGPGDGIEQLMPGFVLIGVGTAFTVPMVAAVLEIVPPARAGVVSAVISVAREISGVLGIAVTGAVLTLRENFALDGGASPDEAFLAGYRTGLLVGAGLAVLGGLIAWVTLRPGQAMLADPYADSSLEPTVAPSPIDELPRDSTPLAVGEAVGELLYEPLRWPDEERSRR
jgi:EmrB/QacA subfamily drug resistance transporter